VEVGFDELVLANLADLNQAAPAASRAHHDRCAPQVSALVEPSNSTGGLLVE